MREGEAVGDTAHEIGVADPGERSRPDGAGGGVGVGDVRRLPALHRVNPGGTAVGALHGVPQKHQRAVVEQCVAAALERGGDLLPDHVVREQQAAPVLPRTERVQDVLAVGGPDGALEDRVGERPGDVEGLGGAGGQVVAAGKDDPLVLGEPVAGGVDPVQPLDGAEEPVEDEMAPGLLLVRTDAQQHERTALCVGDLGVGERLEGFGDRLPVDPVGGLRVVGGLEREMTTERGDEERGAVPVPGADGDVRVPAGDVCLAPRDGPGEVVRRREHVVALAAGVEEGAG